MMASFEEDQAAIRRRQMIAEQLMQQGAEPMDTNQMAGGYVVPVSPLSGLAKVAQQLGGAYIAKQAEQKQTDLTNKKAEIAMALFSGSEPPTLDAIAASGLASPESMVAMGSNLMNAKAEHANKAEDRKLAADLAAKQHEADNQFRAQQAQLAREQTFAQQQQMAQLAASLRPAPQPRQDALVQVMGENGQPVYMPSSQAVGKQPFTASSSAAAINTPKQRQQDALDAINIINEAEPLINSSTSSGAGYLFDKAAAAIGKSTDGADTASQLSVLGGALVSKMPKMSGPQSDKDVLLYQQMAGRLGDATVPKSQKVAALKTLRRLQETYAGVDHAPPPDTQQKEDIHSKADAILRGL